MVNNQNDKIQQVLDRVQDDNIEFIRMEFLDYTGVTTTYVQQWKTALTSVQRL